MYWVIFFAGMAAGIAVGVIGVTLWAMFYFL